VLQGIMQHTLNLLKYVYDSAVWKSKDAPEHVWQHMEEWQL